MTKQVIALEARLDSGPAEGSVKSLKAQLREAQAEVQQMSEKFGLTSEQAQKAARRAAELKDAIGDAKSLTDAFNPDAKFKAFGNALQGVVGGFTALQGAQALFGSESKELEKTLLKVQGAMALSQGLNAIGEAGDAFKVLGAKGVEAFNKIKVAIGSTGIGLLVVALGTIYAYWDDIKGAVNGVSEEQEKLNAKTKANVDSEKQKLTQLNNQDNILKLQGKSEEDILKLKITQYDAVIKATEAQIAQSEITKNAQVAAAQRNKEILKGLLNFLSIPITAVLYAVDQVRNALGGTSTLLEDYKEGLAKMVFDPEQVKKDGDKEIQEQKNALQTLKNERAGFQIQIKAINKKGSDDKKAQAEKDAQDLLNANKEQNNLQRQLEEELTLSKVADERKRAELKLEMDLENKKREIENSKASTKEKNETIALLEQQYMVNLRAMQDKFAQEDKVKEAEKEQREKEHYERLIAGRKVAADKSVEIARAESQAKTELNDAYLNSIGAGLGILKMFADKNKGLQKAILIAENGLTIARIIIDTQRAIVSARASVQGIPPFLPGPVPVPNPKYILAQTLATKSIVQSKIAAGIGIAQAIAATAKGLSSIGGGGSAGGGGNVGGASGDSGGGVGATAPIPPQLGQTALNQQLINATGNAAVRAFVLETDVSGNQERIKRLNRAARIN